MNYKRKLFVFFVISIICAVVVSCNDKKYIESTDAVTPVPSVQTTVYSTDNAGPEKTPEHTEYVPTIFPDSIGIYIPSGDGTSSRVSIKEFKAERCAKTDIDCFEVFATNETVVSGGSFADMWRRSWEKHGNNPSSKIGFKLEFTLADGQRISKNILKPSDSSAFYEYVEVYIYDDINQDGGWYSHLEDDDIDERTIMSSIKLTSGSRIEEVGDITLSAFIYNNHDNFDDNGNYIGSVIAAIRIYE